MPSTIVIVHGAGASGKTFVSRALAANLSLPLLAKDDFKEIIFDRLGWEEDVEHSRLLGQLAFDLLYHSVELMVSTETDFIVEGKFEASISTEKFQDIMNRRGFTPIQVLCQADPEVRLRRAVERRKSGTRHPGHVDHLYLAGLTTLPSTEYEPLGLSGTVHVFDTSNETESDIDELVAKLRAMPENPHDSLLPHN